MGIGYRPELRVARKRTRVGDIGLAPGRKLGTLHAFVDASAEVSDAAVEEMLEELVGRGATALAVSGAFAVDTPHDEDRFVRAARQRGIPACAGHELTGAYGLETRTLTAAINASILPIVERTAAMVEEALVEAQLDVPLLVLRGDGGSMSSERFRDQPSLTIGSAPAAGVAAVLHELRLTDGIVIECGGTSTNVSVVRAGRAQLRSLRVMRQPTFIRRVDSWVVGSQEGACRSSDAEAYPTSGLGAPISRGSRMPRLQPSRSWRRKARARRAARRRPGGVRCVDAAGGRYALTTTCASIALGLTSPAHTRGAPGGGSRAFEPLAERLRGTGEDAARALLDMATRKVAAVISEAAKQSKLPADVPLVALGGAGAALVPEVARRLDRSAVLPGHAEVLSAVGAAVSLVRAEVVRTIGAGLDLIELAHAAERECIDAGAAPSTVTVETKVDNSANVVRAAATGSVALQTGAAEHHDASDEERDRAAATALEIGREHVHLVAENEYYRVYSGNGSGGVAVVDRFGAIALAEEGRVVSGPPARSSTTSRCGLVRLEAARRRNVAATRLDPRGLAHARPLGRAHARGDRSCRGEAARGGAPAGRRRHRALMSLYREASGRSRTVIGGAALGAVAMLAIGFFVGRATAPEPSLEAQVADVREDARAAADALELVAIHYGATNDTTREAARTQLDRAEESFEGVEDELALLNPPEAARPAKRSRTSPRWSRRGRRRPRSSAPPRRLEPRSALPRASRSKARPAPKARPIMTSAAR